MTSGLTYSVVTGSLGSDNGGATVVFTPSAWLFDSADSLSFPPTPITVTCDYLGNFTTESQDGTSGLLNTDNANLSPDTWTWQMEILATVNTAGEPITPIAWTFSLPADSGSPVDISALTLTLVT